MVDLLCNPAQAPWHEASKNTHCGPGGHGRCRYAGLRQGGLDLAEQQASIPTTLHAHAVRAC